MKKKKVKKPVKPEVETLDDPPPVPPKKPPGNENP